MTERREPRQPGARWICECGQQLVAARTRSGRIAPITVDPKEEGNVLLFRSPAEGAELSCRNLSGPALEGLREQEVPLRLNHFATCPIADRFRR